jgi:ABC-type multidrug transport system fused ATPase/permease subunit
MADQIVVLSNGEVDSMGTHASLMEAGGWYEKAFQSLSTEVK